MPSIPAPSPGPLLAEAVALHRAGQTESAAAVYRQILASTPFHCDALHLLGVLYAEQGRPEGLDLLSRALQFEPNEPIYLVNYGLALAKAGRLVEAAASYRAALARRPDDPATWGKLSKVLLRAGQPHQAVAALSDALRLHPNHPDLHNALGVAYQQSGQAGLARPCFEQAAALDPSYAEAFNNLANLLQLEGHLDQAIAGYRRALEAGPVYPEARWNLARALLAAGRFPEAATELDACLAAAPHHAEAWFERGNAFHQTGALLDAIACYRRAVSERDSFPEAWYNLGVVLMMTNQLEASRASYEKVLSLDHGNVQARNNLGHVLQALGENEAALLCYRQALADQPDYLDARYNLAVTLQSLERFPEAIEAYQEVLRRKPDHADAANNLGGIYLSLNQISRAAGYYQQALDHTPDHPDAAWNLALIHLQTGDFARGWAGYEVRLHQKTFPQRDFPAPLWRGEPLEGRHILVWAEQGLGDAIQFSRYLPLVAARGARVTFECPSRLAPLLRTLPQIEVVAKGEPLPTFDYHVPLLSLPHRFGTRFDSIPPPCPIAIPEPARTFWRDRLARHPGFRIGLSWAGNPASKTGKLRSLPVEALAPLTAIEGVVLFSLQRRDPDGPAVLPGVLPIEAGAASLLDTAAIVRALDLVLTVDTMMAHLAGTLGRPVWTLLPFAADWRWLVEREDSPWYPSMRLVRQRSRNDWPDLIARVARELSPLISGVPPP